MHKEIVYTIPKEENGLMIKTVLSHSMDLSRHEISRLKFSCDGILLNGKKERVTESVHTGDELKISFPDQAQETGSSYYAPQILYEDEDLIVVNKPSGMPVHASHSHLEDNLGTALQCWYKRNGQNFTVRSIGRLDQDVSGLMIYAKNQPAAARLFQERENGLLKKTYIAVAEGLFAKKEGTLVYKILKEEGRKARKVDVLEGSPCITKYRIIQETEKYSVAEVQIETGRTHQIRAGFAYFGHPLAGDALYGGHTDDISRPALHCQKAALLSPFSRKTISVTAPIPDEMKKLI